MSANRIGLVAALLLSACATRGRGPAPLQVATAWEAVAAGVTLVADDASENALLVRADGPVLIFAPPAPPGRVPTRPSTPSLDGVPAHARTLITSLRGLRWFAPDGWRRPPLRGVPDERLGGPWAPPLEQWSLVEGVLVEVPLLGPEQGLPRPRCVVDLKAGWADTALAGGREDHLLLADEGRAAAVVVASCEVLPVQVPGHSPLRVRPALSPDGRVAAVALARLPGPATGGRSEAPFAVAVIDHGRIVEVVPLSKTPVALHVAAGALFAEVEESRGRTLLRHPLPRPTVSFTTDRERAAMRHGAGLRARLHEAVAAGELTEAIDTLRVLRADGLFDLASPDELGLEAELVRKVRPQLVKTADAARIEGALELAALLDRRTRLLDGRPAFDVLPTLPTLQLALQWPESMPLAEDSFGRLLSPPHVRRVDGCPPPEARGPGSACISLAFSTAGDARPVGVRAAAERYVTRRLACLDDGEALLVHDDEGPRSTWSCDREAQSVDALAAFRQALLVGSRPERPVVTVTYDDGGTERLEIPGLQGLTPAEAALELALMRQGERELARLRSGEADAVTESRYLRTLLWRRPPLADGAIAAVVAADGKLRRRPPPQAR